MATTRIIAMHRNKGCTAEQALKARLDYIKALPHNANPWQTCYNRAMNKQMSLSALSDELSQVRTKKREFLAEIDRIVPWGEWISLIRPCYYKGERGNKPYDLERMLRIYLVQNLYNLSDDGNGSRSN